MFAPEGGSPLGPPCRFLVRPKPYPQRRFGGGASKSFFWGVFDGFPMNGFGPWFSNSGFGIRVLEVGKDFILYCKHSI